MNIHHIISSEAGSVLSTSKMIYRTNVRQPEMLIQEPGGIRVLLSIHETHSLAIHTSTGQLHQCVELRLQIMTTWYTLRFSVCIQTPSTGLEEGAGKRCSECALNPELGV